MIPRAAGRQAVHLLSLLHRLPAAIPAAVPAVLPHPAQAAQVPRPVPRAFRPVLGALLFPALRLDPLLDLPAAPPLPPGPATPLTRRGGRPVPVGAALLRVQRRTSFLFMFRQRSRS